MSGKLADNLRTSVAIGAVHGTHQERSICENQMVAAANELDERFRQILALEAKVERLSKAIPTLVEALKYIVNVRATEWEYIAAARAALREAGIE